MTIAVEYLTSYLATWLRRAAAASCGRRPFVVWLTPPPDEVGVAFVTGDRPLGNANEGRSRNEPD